MKFPIIIVGIYLLAFIIPAEEHATGFQNLHQPAKADTQRVNQLLDKSDSLRANGQIRQANAFLRKAENLADSLHYEDGQEQAYLVKADLLLLQRKVDSAQVVLKQGMKRFPKSKKREYYNLLGTMYSYKGNVKRSIDAFHEAISFIDSTESPAQLAKAKQNIAISYYDSGNKGAAVKYFQQAISLADQASDSTFLAVVLNNIGNMYNDEEDYEKARYYLQRSIDISRAINLKVNELRSLTNMGNTKKGQGEFEEALTYYEQALALSKMVRPNSPPTILMYNIGMTYRGMGELKKAEENLRRSMQFSRQGHIIPGLYYNSMGLGQVASDQGNIPEAIDWAEQAFDAARKTGNSSFISDANRRLYMLNKKQGDYRQALSHLESLKALSDSLSEQEYSQRLVEYETKLELGRQHQINELLSERDRHQQAVLATQRWLIAAAIVIILLLGVIAFIQYRSQKNKEQSIRLLREKQADLETLNQEKNRLFGIVAHDLRSPLSAMKGMLYLLKNGDLSEDKLRKMLSRLEGSILHNLNGIENLLAWAQQQLSGIGVSRSVINVRNVVTDVLSDQLFAAQQKGIKLLNEVSDDFHVNADPDLLRLILRNLIGNGIKFCEEGDYVKVDAYRVDEQIEIKVADTGIGIPADHQATIFNDDFESRTGTNQEKGSGLGLNLCKQFVQAQGGTIRFESREKEETTFMFTLPVAEVGVLQD